MGEMPSIEDRVRAGAALLDEKSPGWATRIDLTRLDMQTEDRCILGQLWGLWKHGLDALGLPRNYFAAGSEAVPYGFDLSKDMPKSDYPLLTEAWRRVIAERVTSTSSPSEALAAAREPLAAYAHRAWSGWMAYLFEKSVRNSDGTVTIPAWAVERWTRQVETDYVALPESEQESDRKEADEMLAILAAYREARGAREPGS